MNEDIRAQILAEIDELAGVPEMQPGDITLADLSKLWNGVTDATVVARMKKPVADGLFTTWLVYDPGIRRTRRVYRKVE